MFGANVELVDISTFRCKFSGVRVSPIAATPSQCVLTRCEMSNNGGSGLTIVNYRNNNISQNVCLKNCISHHNSTHGIYVYGKGVINIHGNATAIHSNGAYGIIAYFAKVVIHLPSHHNTSYNNRVGDRHTEDGGTITNVEH